MTTTEITQQCKKVLHEHYGSRFRGLVLYGSVARHQASVDSDIDLLVLLNQPFNYFVELKGIIEVLYPLQLESDQLISAKPVLLDEYEHGRIQLYRNAKKDGVLI